jgi:hypothetical protein
LIRIASEADNLALAGIELPGNQFSTIGLLYESHSLLGGTISA